MKTDIDKHYETLKAAHKLVETHEAVVASVQAVNPELVEEMLRVPDLRLQFARALLDLEERRQLALGELGEANMKEGGGPLYAYIDRTTQILNLTKEV